MAESRARKPWWMIACAAVLILTAVMHTIAQSLPPDTAELKELTRQMTAMKFPLPGATRTAMELHLGFGWLMSASCVGFALMALAMIGQAAVARRRVMMVIALTMGFYTVIGSLYFFVIPIACFGLACVLAALSLLLDPRA